MRGALQAPVCGLTWGSNFLVVRGDGSLVVGEVSSQAFLPIRQYRLGDSVAWSHPAVAGNRRIVKDGSRLAAYELTDHDHPMVALRYE